MISVTENISLHPLQLKDHEELQALMQRIYPPAYAHYWQDQGDWYVNTVYGYENLKKELTEPKSQYYFVLDSQDHLSKERVIGIFKIIYDCPYPPLPSYKAFKVHRIYLDPTTQGRGIGKTLMNYATSLAQETEHELVWLDAMDTHTQAQAFYTSLGYKKTELQYLDFELLLPEHRPMWYMHTFL